MKHLKYYLTFVFVLISFLVISQTVLRGKVTNNKGEAVTNALVFLDSVKTNVVTNAHGYFRIKVPENTKKITLFSPQYGFMSTDYSGEKRVSFVFIEPIEEKEDL